MLRGKEKGNGEQGSSPCQGRRAGFQARCLCAFWITTGSWCPGLVYIKFRQLLDFPCYCRGIGLLRSPTVVSDIISWHPEGTRSRRSPTTWCPSPAAAVLRKQITASLDGGGRHVWTLGIRPIPPLLCSARGGRGAATPALLSDLRTRCTAVHGSLRYLRCAHCYFNYFIIFMV